MYRLFKFARLWILALPVLLCGFGAGLNQIVIISNHDKMPVLVNDRKYSPQGMMDDIHVTMSNDTHLNALADIFDFHDETESIGDLLIDASQFLIPITPFIWGLALTVDKFRLERVL